MAVFGAKQAREEDPVQAVRAALDMQAAVKHFSTGVTASGVGYCWGGNQYGEVGDGTTTERNTPTLVSGGYTWSSISVGIGTVCGVTTSGAGYCWGDNWHGEIGDGTTTERDVPTAVSGGYTWSSIVAGVSEMRRGRCGALFVLRG